MSLISRLYDFVSQTRIKSAEVDNEFNQLVAGHNAHEAGIIANGINIVAAQADADAALEKLMTLGELSVRRLYPDANGIFTEIQYNAAPVGGLTPLVAKSVLSGGTSPKYLIRTVTYYETNGVTIRKTFVYNISYSVVTGSLLNEVIV